MPAFDGKKHFFDVAVYWAEEYHHCVMIRER